METIHDVDAYIAQYPPHLQQILQRIRAAIRAEVPTATEKIAYSIPTFYDGENIIHFGMAKKHVGIYPGPEAIRFFADRLTAYPTSKGAVQLPLDQPIPYDLIREITAHRVATVRSNLINK